MKKTKLHLLVAFLAFGPFAANANSLLDIYELALKNDAQLKADTAAFEAGKEYRNLNRAALLPQINASATYTDNDSDRTYSNNGNQIPATIFPAQWTANKLAGEFPCSNRCLIWLAGIPTNKASS